MSSTKVLVGNWMTTRGLIAKGIFSVATLLSMLFLLAAQPGCRSLDISVYTVIQLRNPLSIVRTAEMVEVPLTVVRERYGAFNENDFSVHLLSRDLYDKGGPMLAQSPPPEVPAQLADRDLDGAADTLLVSLDFYAGETKIIAVASPRYSLLAEKPANEVHLGLWRQEVVRASGNDVLGEGGYSESLSEVFTPSHRPSPGLYYRGGPLFETRSVGFRLSFDSRLAMDVLGKREPRLVLAESARTNASGTGGSWGGSLLGDPGFFGAGSLAMAQGDRVEPLSDFTSVQYRRVSNGPVAAESEILIAGCGLGDHSYDLKWRITAVRGNRHLLHSVTVSRTGHNLAFAVHDGGALRRQIPSTKLGWMRTFSYGPQNVITDQGGSLGLALLALGRQSTGFVENVGDTMAVKFDPMLRNFRWVVSAAWSEEPAGIQSLEEFETSLDELLIRINNPIKVKNLDPPNS